MSKYEPDPIAEISKIHQELAHFDIELLRPDILKSKDDFSIEGSNIRFGLTSIKGISNSSIDKLNHFKDCASNKFEVFQASTEAGINLGVLSALIQAGALDVGDKYTRSKVVLECQLWKILTPRERIIALKFAEQGNDDLINVINQMKVKVDENGKRYLKDSRIETMRKRFSGYKNIFDINSKNESLANWYYENELLGYTHGVTLRHIFLNQNPELVQIEEVRAARPKTQVRFMGTIRDCTGVKVSKNGNEYVKLEVGDETDTIDVLLFNSKRNKSIDDCIDQNGGLPVKKNIVAVRGAKADDGVFANYVTVQDSKIYMKLGQLKNDEKNLS